MYSHSFESVSGYGRTPLGFSLAFLLLAFYNKKRETQMLGKVAKLKKQYAGCLFFR